MENGMQKSQQHGSTTESSSSRSSTEEQPIYWHNIKQLFCYNTSVEWAGEIHEKCNSTKIGHIRDLNQWPVTRFLFKNQEQQARHYLKVFSQIA